MGQSREGKQMAGLRRTRQVAAFKLAEILEINGSLAPHNKKG